MKRAMHSGTIFLLGACLAFAGCGYHTAGHASRLPANVRTMAVPVFTSKTQTYKIEQILTKEVVRELISRTKYHVVSEAMNSDATLNGTVLATQAAPLTYDAQTGRVSSAVVTVTVHVTLLDHSGKILFENPNYVFREQYQVSREVSSFFEESSPALQRLSRDFARTLVSDILEAY